MKVEDLVRDLLPLYETFVNDEKKRTCRKCGAMVVVVSARPALLAAFATLIAIRRSCAGRGLNHTTQYGN
jgi:hypothetical protein